MFLKKLSLRNFRSYERESLDFNGGLNLILGRNGQGKTNLLESIYLLSNLKSFRTSSLEDLVAWGSSSFFVRGLIQQGEEEVTLEVAFDKTNNAKRARVNALEVKRSVDYLGRLEVLLFLPESLYLIKGFPQERRRFLDRAIFSLDPRYLPLVQKYYRVLQQRNNLLGMGTIDSSALGVWSDQLTQWGSQIIWKRLNFIQEINRAVQELVPKLGGDFEPAWIELFYASSVLSEPKGVASGSCELEEVRALFVDRLERVNKEERRRGLSLVGPHRDDLLIRIRGRDLKRFGSQGEQRYGLFTVLLAMLYNFRKKRGFYPIVLLDDLLSELDVRRKEQVFAGFPEEGLQIFFTSAEEVIPPVSLGHRIFHLSPISTLSERESGDVQRRSPGDLDQP